MILLWSILAGLIVGLLRARWQGTTYQAPDLHFPWLVLIAFLPQFFAFYLPATREWIPDLLAAGSLIVSQTLLLIFAWHNRLLAGMWLLICGLILNLAVISANGGFMPISPQTTMHLVPSSIVQFNQLGNRFGHGKDILLLPEDTRLEWLADRLLLPDWFPYQVAFSPGDVFIAIGVFCLLVNQKTPGKTIRKEEVFL